MVWNIFYDNILSPEIFHGKRHGIADLLHQLYTPWQSTYSPVYHCKPHQNYGYLHPDAYNSDIEWRDDDEFHHQPQYVDSQEISNHGRVIPIQMTSCSKVNNDHYETHSEKVDNDVIDIAEEEEDMLSSQHHDTDVIPLAQIPWVPSLKLTMQDKQELLCGSLLSDKHIYAAQTLLQRQFPNINGFQDSCLSQVGFNPVSEKASMQMHHIGGNHWVLSSSIGGSLVVYDSLYSSIPSDLKEQLSDIYLNFVKPYSGVVDARIAETQKQSGSSDCALFVIGWAYEICRGRDIEEVYLSQNRLRSHLVRCFEDEELCSFPQSNCVLM